MFLEVSNVLKVGDDASLSFLQGTLRASRVAVGDSKPTSRPISNEMKRIVIADKGKPLKPGHVFKENSNYQIINLVLNGVDS